ncbi:MAG TPA: DNA polymerase domain-containing protein, partial [Candidatus Nanoarchaeia archaeon]|nr:DNA polymerase domain-containing protein [Candidatus Nanoarchaeia archaeon]
ENFWFCSKRKGFLPTIIEDIITRRTRIKEILNQGKKEIKDNKFLAARSNALKLLANSFYGYLGFFGARYYSLESAESTTAYGRYYIRKVISSAEASGFRVVYSDTDSVFLILQGRTEEDVLKFAERINAELPGVMELEYEGLYPAGIFVSAKGFEGGAKKKYALVSEEGIMKIRGFETVRRNWSLIAKEAQENVLSIILKERDDNKALQYVKSVIGDLRNREIPVEKVVIFTQLQKNIEDYDSKGPHVAAAQRLKNQGVSVGPGTMIKYVVTSGSDAISSRVKLPDEVKGNEYDSSYYIENQVVPSVEKILSVFGYTKDDIMQHREQKSLEGFF